MLDKNVLTAATAELMCRGIQCYKCNEFFHITDESCPRDYADQKEKAEFMQNLYLKLIDKCKDNDWTDISFEDIEDILKE